MLRQRLHDPAFLARMPKDLPLLFLSGDADPVGEQGKGVRRAIQSLKEAGVQNIESIFYPGARHELLVETNKQEVFADIAAWLDKQLTKLKITKGLLHKTCRSPLAWNKYFDWGFQNACGCSGALFHSFGKRARRKTRSTPSIFVIILHFVYTAAVSAPRRGSYQDRCGSALRPAR